MEQFTTRVQQIMQPCIASLEARGLRIEQDLQQWVPSALQEVCF